jgi:deferrochelatase/peroxidase EfeB
LSESRSGITRRDALQGVAALGLGAGLDHALFGSRGVGASSRRGIEPTVAQAAVPFHGANQAGIATPAQDYLCFAAFDLTTDAADELRLLLQQWTAAAAAITAGQLYTPASQQEDEAPEDPGEALELGPARLTVTFGIGPGALERTGLTSRKPAELRPLPSFQGDDLEPARSGGDLCVQACAEDPQVVFHAVHLLARVASSAAVLRWSQIGFGRTSSTSTSQKTPRNLMGFKDGTANIRAEEEDAMNRFVWVKRGDGPAWMAGGTYLIVRRIRMLFDVWDTTTLEGQERVFGRYKVSGAPLGAAGEFDPIDLHATRNGEPVIPASAHIRLASPQYNAGQRILRRGYSYSEATEAGTGEIDAGLFFIAFQRSPSRQFVPIQRRLAAEDALNHTTVHTSSAIFACPPGVTPGGFIGEGLFR